MDIKKVLNRLLWMPFGIIKGLLYIGNQKARDHLNKLHFPKAFIEGGCCFTADTVVGDYSHIEGSTLNHCKIGSYTYLSNNCLIQNATIGNYCSIATEVNIGLGRHPLTLFSTSPVFYKIKNKFKIILAERDLDFIEYQSINIGSDVWIGARVIIMDGVTVGHGAVLAAGSVITKDVPPYAIVGGIPAKIIRYRFSQVAREELLKTFWWEKSAEEVFSIREKLSAICNK